MKKWMMLAAVLALGNLAPGTACPVPARTTTPSIPAFEFAGACRKRAVSRMAKRSTH